MLSGLQKKLGYKFKDVSLLKTALTHSSYANENKKLSSVSNERLEFLGDSVLGMATARLLFSGFPGMSEGSMTKLRAELVCEKNLAAIAAGIGLGECLSLGRGEEKGGGRTRPSILADAVEAVLAAVYLDGGIKQAEKLVAKFFMQQAENLNIEKTDYKSALQEIVQLKADHRVTYRTIDESGPDHRKLFTAEVMVNSEITGHGTGPTKKEAEQMAAKHALEKVKAL